MSTNQAQYGRLPGVRIDVNGGSISNTQIGREQKLVLFGRGDTDSGTADPNEYYQIRSRVQASDYFGNGSQLADGIENALNNKGNFNFIYGVAAEETDVSAESVSGDGGNLTNYPIVEDTSLITVVDTGDSSSTTLDVEFGFESPLPTPSSTDTAIINPLNGDVEADDSNELEVDYTHLDWQGALDAADQVLNHAEVGIYCALSDAEQVAVDLSHKLSGDPSNEQDRGLRGEYKLAMGLAGAEPNATNDNGEPVINPDSYSDALDDDALFLAGPVRLAGDMSHRTVLSGIAGRFAGNALTNPLYGDRVSGFGQMSQALSRSEREGLRGRQVMPVVDDYRDGENITVEGHHSTSTATDWDRTFQNRRITDLVILMQRRVAEAARDNLMRDQQLDQIEAQIVNGFEELATEGLIYGAPEGQNQGQDGLLSNIGQESQSSDTETPYFATAIRSDVNTISVSSGFSPVGVTTGVDGSITVADRVDSLNIPDSGSSDNGGDS